MPRINRFCVVTVQKKKTYGRTEIKRKVELRDYKAAKNIARNAWRGGAKNLRRPC